MFVINRRLLVYLLPALLLATLACSDEGAAPGDSRSSLDRTLVDGLAEAGQDLAADLAPTPDQAGPLCPEAGVDSGAGAGLVALSGDVLNFFGSPNRIAGAGVSLLESPCRRVVSDSKGHYLLSGLKQGSEATLALSHKDFPPQQTGTITLGPSGAQRFSRPARTAVCSLSMFLPASTP